MLEAGEPGQVYNVGGPDEMANIDVVKRILELTGRDESLISYVKDRPGHDRRYSLSSDRLEALGWSAAVPFDEGIARTVEWYRENEEWWGPIRSGEYREYYERQLRARRSAELAPPADRDRGRRSCSSPTSTATSAASWSRRSASPSCPDLGIDVRLRPGQPQPLEGPVLRGIHMQQGQAKLVRCPRGRIWDVAVDLRPDSPTYKQWEGHELDGESHRQLFVPAGFGHGFCVLSDEADVLYRLSTYYDPELESGVAWDDPELGDRVADRRPDPLRARQERAEAGRARPRLARVQVLARQGLVVPDPDAGELPVHEQARVEEIGVLQSRSRPGWSLTG